jgi:hypothetical protein
VKSASICRKTPNGGDRQSGTTSSEPRPANFSLPAGTRIKVTAFQAKDGALRGSTRDIEFPDGRKMDMGGSASKDGQDKQDK